MSKFNPSEWAVSGSFSNCKSEIGGEPVQIYTNDFSSEVFAMDVEIHNIILLVQGKLTNANAQRISPEAWKSFGETLPNLIQSGVLKKKDASTAPTSSSPAGPLESRYLFARFDLLEIGNRFRFATPMARFAFSRLGASLMFALLVFGLYQAVSNTGVLLGNFWNIGLSSSWHMTVLGVVIIATKAIHELAHALATRHFFEVEGFRAPPIRAGISFFFFMPFPFTNTTLAWQLRSKWHRAAIAAAGMYAETTIGCISLILALSINEGSLQNTLFTIVFVTTISTIVFNLNPLLRLDGYFILIDVFDVPNLATRARTEASQLLFRFFGGGKSKTDVALITYWFLSFGYRCGMFLGVAIVAFLQHEVLGLMALAVGVSLLFVRPMLATLKKLPDTATPRIASVRAGVLTVAAAFSLAMFVPVPNNLVLEGRIEFSSLKNIYPETPGVLRLGPSQAGTGERVNVARVRNPELMLSSQISQLDVQIARLKYRNALLNEPEFQNDRLSAIHVKQSQHSEVLRQIRQQSTWINVGDTWQVANQGLQDGSWYEPSTRQSIGKVLPKGSTPTIVARLPQDERTTKFNDLLEQNFLVRSSGDNVQFKNARATSIRQVATRTTSEKKQLAEDATGGGSSANSEVNTATFEVILDFDNSHASRTLELHGKEVTVLLRQPSRFVWQHLWTQLQRLRQKRIRLEGV